MGTRARAPGQGCCPGAAASATSFSQPPEITGTQSHPSFCRKEVVLGLGRKGQQGHGTNSWEVCSPMICLP